LRGVHVEVSGVTAPETSNQSKWNGEFGMHGIIYLVGLVVVVLAVLSLLGLG
jgi:hypothetical protein